MEQYPVVGIGNGCVTQTYPTFVKCIYNSTHSTDVVLLYDLCRCVMLTTRDDMCVHLAIDMFLYYYPMQITASCTFILHVLYIALPCYFWQRFKKYKKIQTYL